MYYDKTLIEDIIETLRKSPNGVHASDFVNAKRSRHSVTATMRLLIQADVIVGTGQGQLLYRLRSEAPREAVFLTMQERALLRDACGWGEAECHTGEFSALSDKLAEEEVRVLSLATVNTDFAAARAVMAAALIEKTTENDSGYRANIAMRLLDKWQGANLDDPEVCNVVADDLVNLIFGDDHG